MTKEQLKKDIETRVALIVGIYDVFLSDELKAKTLNEFIEDVCEGVEAQYKEEGVVVDKEEVYRYTKEAMETFREVLPCK